MPKYPRYQDYVIKEGRLVGEFERMYQDFDDPWQQTNEEYAHDKKYAKRLFGRVAIDGSSHWAAGWVFIQNGLEILLIWFLGWIRVKLQ